jgi:hypothetical protein
MSWKRTALIVPLIATVSAAAYAQDQITPPAVPTDVAVEAGYTPFLRGHAVGTQNYICAPSATSRSGRDWLFIGPQATVFDADSGQILTHFQSTNPFDDAIEATWQHSRDTSAVWAVKVRGSSDPTYVAPGAVEWLLLRVTGQQIGPTGGDKLTSAAYIQRVNTAGGVKPPESECRPTVINHRRLVPYEADYYFYR